MTILEKYKVNWFHELSYERGIRKVRKGKMHANPQNRTQTALSDPYKMYFGDVVNDPLGCLI